MELKRMIAGFTLKMQADGYSPNTIELYTWALNLLSGYCVDELSKETVISFYAYVQTSYIPRRSNGDKSPLSGRSVENIWTALRTFFHWAFQEQYLPLDMGLYIRRPVYDTGHIKPFTQAEVQKLIDACLRTSNSQGRRNSFQMRRPTRNRDIAIIKVLLDTGLRASELSRLRVEDVSLEGGTLSVAPFGTGRKTKARTVFIGAMTKKAIWKHLAEREYRQDDYLFVTIHGGPMDRNSIRLLLDKLGRRAEVKDCHPHRFRHTFAIQYLRNGGDVFTLQRILGHSSLSMVRRYLDLADRDASEVHQKASPVDRWKI